MAGAYLLAANETHRLRHDAEATAGVSDARTAAGAAPPADTKDYRASYNLDTAQLKGVTATTFVQPASGTPAIRYRLWGLVDARDPRVREEGRRFLDRWLRSFKYICVDAEKFHRGERLVWLSGHERIDGNEAQLLGDANIELVQRGLAKVDYKEYANARFSGWDKVPEPQAMWRAYLGSAQKQHQPPD